MIRAVLRLVLIVVIAAAVGIGYAQFRGKPLIPDIKKIEAQKSEHELWVAQTAISLGDFVTHYESGGLVIDARAKDVFEAGHLNAPMIMNIPAEEAANALMRVDPYRGLPIVLYCSSQVCEDAETLWRFLNSVGFSTEVRVFHPGWDGILAAKLPTVAGPDPLAQADGSAAVDGAGQPPTEPTQTPSGGG